MTNKLPNPNNPTFQAAAVSLLLLAMVLAGVHQVTGQENPREKDAEQPLQAEKPPTKDPQAAEKNRQALETLKQARQRIEGYDSLKADLRETALIGKRRFQATGTYLHASGNRVKQELQVELKGADGKPLTGRLLEISDGEVMHTSHQIGDQQNITRRDVREIFAAIEKYPTINAELMRAKLGFGGIPALLASLQKAFHFQEYKLETIQDSQYIMIGGGWREGLLERMRPKDAGDDYVLPPYIPDYVRVFFHQESLFPHRVFYYKRTDDGLRPMLTLDFLNVQRNVPTSKDDFEYFRPKDIVPTDITQELIKRIINSAQSSAPQSPAPPNGPDSATPPKAPTAPAKSGT